MLEEVGRCQRGHAANAEVLCSCAVAHMVVGQEELLLNQSGIGLVEIFGYVVVVIQTSDMVIHEIQ